MTATFWVVSNGNWDTAANWNTGVAPGAADEAVISASGSYTVTISTPITVASIMVDNAATTLSVNDPGQTVTDSGDLVDGGQLLVDWSGGQGGTSLSIGGALTSSNFVGIGNLSLSAPTLVTANALVDTGTIDIYGSSSNQAALDVNAPAGFGVSGVLTGVLSLVGDALLEFSSGQITTIANNATLALDGPEAFVADSGGTSSNSALTGLSQNAGVLNLRDGASVSVSGDLENSGQINVDNYGNDSGSGLSVAGTLTNAGGLGIGDSGLTAPDTVTVGALVNAGAISISGNASAGEKATLDVNGIAGSGAPGLLTGAVDLTGDALLEFSSGQITTVANNATLTLDGPEALVADSGATTSNSALSGLSQNAGVLNLRDGASVSVSGDIENNGQINVDNYGNDSGSGLSVVGTLTNAGGLGIGDSGLTAPDTVTVGALVNAGVISISGNASAGEKATLDVNGIAGSGAPGLLTGAVDLTGDALLEFSSGQITTVANNATLTLDGPEALVADSGATTSNSALSGLSQNAGILNLRDGASVSVSGDLENSGQINVDNYGNDSGSGLSVAGTLTNAGGLGIGDSGLTAPDTVTVGALVNTGSTTLSGSTTDQATLTVNGVADNAGSTVIGADSDLNVTGGDNYAQAAGTTTVTGALAATDIDVTGGTLDGAGTVTGNVVNTGGVVQGGTNSPGALTIDGDYTQGATGELQALITGTASGQVGALNVSGNVNLQNGLLELDFSNFTPALGQSFTLMTFTPGALSGTFGTIEDGGYVGDGGSVDIGGGLSLALTYDDAGGTITAQVVSSNATDSWNGDNANWSTASDWSTGAVPGSSDNAVLGGTSGYTVTIAAPISPAASLDISDSSATLSIQDTTTQLANGDVTNVGAVNVDSSSAGGSAVTIGGTLRNAGTFRIGNSGITSSASVTASGLDNLATNNVAEGVIDLTGGSASGNSDEAELNILAAAPSSLTGQFNLAGDALLQFSSGGIAGIGGGSGLTLIGGAPQVAISGNSSNNNALDTLAANDGTLDLIAGAAITTNAGVNFDNTGAIDLDNFIQPGGSSLTIGGVLTNSGQIQLGAAGLERYDNDGIIAPDMLTANGLNNSGSIAILGSTAAVNPAQASVNILAAAPTTLTGTFSLAGNALVQFASGGITSLGGGSGLTLSGAMSQVAISGASGDNNALTNLTENDGNLHLDDGASIATNAGVNFDNIGTLGIDSGDYDTVGSSLTIGGVLTNSGQIALGNGGNSSETLTAGGLNNLVAPNDDIVLVGNTTPGSSSQALFNILAAAPSILAGQFNLSGNALLQFASGAITSIGGSSSLTLNGGAAQVAISGNTANNNALDTLAENDGDLHLDDGASIATNAGVNFDNTGALGIDNGDYDAGGSSLTIGGALTNSGQIALGNGGNSSETLTAGGLDNLVAPNDDIVLAGNTAAGSTSQALLNVLAAAPSILTGAYTLVGNALLQFAGGGITSIGGASSLTLNGATPQVAISGASGNNNALDTLAENDGTLQLVNGAAIATNPGTDFDNNGNLQVDAGGNGGGSLAVGGVLTNDGYAQIGNDGLSIATPVSASGLDNAGAFNLSDATLSLTGALDNSGNLNIGDGGISLPTSVSAASLDNVEAGAITLTGDAAATASLVIQGLATNAATLQLNPGGFAELGGLDNIGTVNLSGNAGTPSSLGIIGSAANDGAINIGAFAQMGVTGSFDDSGAITLAGSLDLGGPMTVDPLASLSMQGGSVIGNGAITIDAGANVSGDGAISVTTTNDGAITASGGLLDVASAIAGTGALAIGASGAELEIGGATTESMSFGGNVGTLKLDAPTSFTGAITGLVQGDTIDLAGVQATSAVVNGSTLTVTAGSQTLTYQVAGAGLSGNVFVIENDQHGGSDLVLGPPGPVISGPGAQTVFTDFPAVLGPISIADPTAGNSPLTVTVSDAAGLLSAAPAGAGTVSGDDTNALTLTGDLPDIDAMLAGLTYLGASAGTDTVNIQVTDSGQSTAALSLALTTDAVPITAPVLNAPNSETTIVGTSTAMGGISVSDPYAETTGQSLALNLQLPAGAGTLDVNGPSGPVVTGAGTNDLMITGTVEQLNNDIGDAIQNKIIAYGLAALASTVFASFEQGIFQAEKVTLVAISLSDAEQAAPGLYSLEAYENAELATKMAEAAAELLKLFKEAQEKSQEWAENIEQLVDGSQSEIVATTFGDAHIVTFDGGLYDLNAKGEFILAESTEPGDSFQVQVRLQPWNDSQSATVITQVAVEVGTDRVTIGIGRADIVLVDGSPTALSLTNPIALDAGALIQTSSNGYLIATTSGETVAVTDYGSYLSVSVGPGESAGAMAGLMGPDTAQANDFTLPDGTVLQQPLTTAQLYSTFANAWRVTQPTSILDYAPGQSTATFTDTNFPETPITLSDLPADIVSVAAAAAGGITDPNVAAAAEFDYLVTGNASFVDSDSTVSESEVSTGQTATPAQVTPSSTPPAMLGVIASEVDVAESQTGPTAVTFDVYLTAAESSDTEVDYEVVAPNSDDLGASAFGGALPSGEITLAAGATSSSFTIDVPEGALGSLSSADLAVAISSPGATSIFAPDAQAVVVAPEPGPPPLPEIAYLTTFGNFIQDGNNYTLDLGAVQLGETLPTLKFAIENAANAPSDQLTGTFAVPTVVGFSVSGDTIPTPIDAGDSYQGLTVSINQDKFGAQDETITFDPVDTNASGYSAPLSPITLTIADTLELPSMIYSQAFGDVHIITYNGLTYNFQATGDFVLAQSRIPGDNFQIQMQLAPWYAGASVTTIQEVAIALGADDVTFSWMRGNTVLVDGAATTLSMADPTLTLSGGSITEVSPSMFKVNWNTGETMTVSNVTPFAGEYPDFISITDGVPGNVGPGAYAGLQGEDEGQQNDIQLADGQVLPQPVSSAELYGEYANSWAVSSATSLFGAPLLPTSAPADPLTLSDLPQNLVNQAAALVAAAGITDPGIAQAAELDYLATGDPSFITADANIQQQVVATTPATVTASTTPAIAVGVGANAASVTEAASGETAVTFNAYLTGAEVADTTVDYAVVSPGAGYLGASAFGGTLPSSSVTIAAGQTTAQFTIDLPQGALGSDPSDNLQVEVSDTAGVPIFAPTAQTEIVNNQPEPGNLAQPVLAEISGDGTLSFDSSTNTYTLNLGGLVEGSALQAVQLAVVNAATVPADNLGGSFTAPTGTGFTITGNDLPSSLAPGENYQGLYVSVKTNATGSNAMTMTFDPTDVNDSGYSAALTPITLDIVDSVTAAATPTVNTPTTIIFPNAHVGATDSQHVSVTNSAAAGAANLDVTLTASGEATASGAISQLAPGATDATDLSVGLNTSAAGPQSGSVTENFVSDLGGGNTSPIALADPYIDVFGGVYRLADPSILSNPLTVHVGDSGDQTLTITNIDPSDGYSENLIATVVGTTGALTASGTTGDIAPQADGTIAVKFSTATAGSVGTVTLDLKSDGTGIDGLGMTDLGDVTIPVAVTSGNVPAAAQFEELSGGGTFSQKGSAYSLNLGTITAPTTVNLGVLNSAEAPADTLAGSFTISGATEFTNSGFDAFSGISAGSADTAPTVTLFTGVTGAFSETITLQPTDATTDTALSTETLTITGTVNTATPPSITAPSAVTVQQSQASPVTGISITDPDAISANQTVTVNLADSAGLLTANTGATGGGGTITGSGTTALAVSGTLAQVNADLTTLTDTDGTTSADSIVVGSSDSVGGVATPATIAVTVQAQQTATVGINPIDGNNIIDYAEANAATGVPLSGSVSGLAAGATFTVSVVDGSFAADYTAIVNSAATGWTASMPSSDAVTLPNGAATFTAQVNASIQASEFVTVAETLPTVTISPVDGDNVINHPEASAAAGVPLAGTVSGLAAGATFDVSVSDGAFSNNYTATVDAAGTGWTATIPEADAITLPNGTATLTAQVTDAYGNQSTLATDQVTVAETLPTVTISPVDGDNVINRSEANAAAGVPLAGTVSGLAAGATFDVSVSDGAFSNNYTATVDAAGTGWTATIPEADAITLPNGTATLTAQVTDAYGNQSTLATDQVTVAETLPTVTISPVDGDNVINRSEANAAAGVPLAGTVSGLATGATFDVSVSDGAFSNNYTATVDAAGTGWTATIPEADAITLPNGTATLTAQVTDAYGNQSTLATDQVTVAETLPTVTISPVDGDNVINRSEANAADGVPLAGTVSGLATGATFDVSVSDGAFSNTYTATVDAAGTGWTATIPEADAITLPNGTATLTAQVTDAYGNQSTLATDQVTWPKPCRP